MRSLLLILCFAALIGAAEHTPAIVAVHGVDHFTFFDEHTMLIKGKDGTQEWYKDNQLHHEGEPALIRSNGERRWYISGKLHREDGPAIEELNGDQMWYRNGKLHREDGPAITSTHFEAWYHNGKRHRTEGLPALTFSNGRKEWWVNGKLSREDGPAIECANGIQIYVNASGQIQSLKNVPASFNMAPDCLLNSAE